MASGPSNLNALLTMSRYPQGMSEACVSQSKFHAVAWIARGVLTLIVMLLAFPASSQTTTAYVAPADGSLDSSNTCTNPLVRNFNVTSNAVVTDVDVGVYVTHSVRGALQMTLQSPQGTRVQIVDAAFVAGDNFNVRLNDGGTQAVNSDGFNTNHSTATPPPFQNNFTPSNPLNAFNGQSSSGTWRLEICNLSIFFLGSGNGTFRHAELYLTTAVTDFADLSLTKTLVGNPPANGGTATYSLTVTNASNSNRTATGITVRDTFPSQFSFVSAVGAGSFNSGTRVWTVPNLAPGASASIELKGTIAGTAGTTVTNVAEIISSSVADIDSTPNNGANNEDDFASVSFAVQPGRPAGIPPVLACPAGSSLFDWDLVTNWTPGSTDNSFALGTYGNIRFRLSNDGTYLNNATFGGQNPTVFDYFTGGLPSAGDGLTIVSDQNNRSGEVILTITLPRGFTGLQFSIFDVDFGANQFADRVTVSGLRGTNVVTPTLTNGNANYVSGNSAFGEIASAENEGLGNVVVTFTQTVDTIIIRYGNHSSAPADPGQQGIGLHDIAYCLPNVSLAVTKVSSIVSDPVNGATSPKAIPGALIEYVISVTNTGSDTPDDDSIFVTDDAPADAKMCLVAFEGGSGPIHFTDGSPNSGLTYSFTALDSLTDDLEFSADGGSTWAYQPTADADGCDTAISDFRLNPKGSFAASTNFSLRVRFVVE